MVKLASSTSGSHAPQITRTQLRREREARGLTRRQVSIAAGITERAIASLEGGGSNPRLVTAVALSHALGEAPLTALFPELFGSVGELIGPLNDVAPAENRRDG